MGEYADYLIDQMLDEGYSPFSGRQPKGRKDKIPPDRFYKIRGAKKKKSTHDPKIAQTLAHEIPGKNTDPKLLRDYPEETFDMSFFPTLPKPKNAWDINEDEAPF